MWRAAEADQAAVLQAPLSLADRLHLGGAGGQLLGVILCLRPFVALLLAWPALRRRRWAARLGWSRYLLTGALLLSMVGVTDKVLVHVAFGVRYVWVTPWFRI